MERTELVNREDPSQGYRFYRGIRVSKNNTAAEVMGRRPRGTPVLGPTELGYVCPVCGTKDYNELHFSEYHAMLWCEKCNLDIPSCLCFEWTVTKIRQEIELATEVFLRSVQDVVARKSEEERTPWNERHGRRRRGQACPKCGGATVGSSSTHLLCPVCGTVPRERGREEKVGP